MNRFGPGGVKPGGARRPVASWGIAAGAGMLLFILLLLMGLGAAIALILGAVLAAGLGAWLTHASGEASRTDMPPASADPEAPAAGGTIRPSAAAGSGLPPASEVELLSDETPMPPTAPLPTAPAAARPDDPAGRDARAGQGQGEAADGAPPALPAAGPGAPAPVTVEEVTGGPPPGGGAGIPDADDAARPPLLDAPREGRADDLKMVSGIGARLEEQLNGIGVWHLDQIAGWSTPQALWIDDRLGGVRGRVTRDDWVGQARALSARGGDREGPRGPDGAGAA